MNLNSTKMLLLLILFCSTLMSLSSNNWLGGWMGLEINLIAFIPLMNTSMNYFSSESSIKYFIIQSLSSSLLLLSVLLLSFKMFISSSSLILMFSLMIKLGVAPFHTWVPNIMSGISWISCMLLSTWQKIGVLMLLSYMDYNHFFLLPSLLSLLVGSIGGINQSCLKKLMGYSSINNMGWILLSMTSSMFLWLNYFFIYSLMILMIMFVFKKMEINYLNQCLLNSFSSLNKYFISMMLFSLGGLPPTFGFLPKFMIIQLMVFSSNFLIVVFLISTSLLTLFFYIRISVMMILINSTKMKWMQFNFYYYKLFYLFCFISMFGFIFILMLKSLN